MINEPTLEYALKHLSPWETRQLPEHLFGCLSNYITLAGDTYHVEPVPIRIAKRLDEILDGFNIYDPGDIYNTLLTLCTVIARGHNWNQIVMLLDGEGLSVIEMESIVATQNFVNGANDPNFKKVKKFLHVLKARYVAKICIERTAESVVAELVEQAIKTAEENNDD
jgi:hypothetical protein